MTEYDLYDNDEYEAEAAIDPTETVPFAFTFVDASGWTWGWPACPVEHFEPAAAESDEVTGEPAAAMEHWHAQSYPDTCAIVAQEFVLDELTGHDFTEEELRSVAMASGWYTPGGGTPSLYVGALLEAHGIGVERHAGASLDDIRRELDLKHKVIVGVDADELRTSGIDPMRDEGFGDMRGIPGQDANHAVEVIGIDDSDPQHPKVVLNDPGGPDGRGMTLPADKFLDCWADSGNFMVHTTDGPPSWQPLYLPHQPSLAGYYNADGTYHYSSDNTDRDPQTGAIVRRW